jgi:hypothetical protein
MNALECSTLTAECMTLDVMYIAWLVWLSLNFHVLTSVGILCLVISLSRQTPRALVWVWARVNKGGGTEYRTPYIPRARCMRKVTRLECVH